MRKALILLAAIFLLMQLSIVLAATPIDARRDITAQGYNLSQEKDQVAQNGKTFLEYQQQFSEKGLTFKDVKSLQNKGFTYKEILALPEARIRKLLPLYGMRLLRSAPSNYVEVTNVAGSTEYYHPDTGMRAGDFYTQNNGTSITNKIDGFVDDVYGSTMGASVSYMYYLWGEWDDDAETHQGVDMRHGSINPSLSTAHAGQVVGIDETGYGVVSIYNASTRKTYVYAHMTNIRVKVNDVVSVGRIIGTQGRVGANQSHLHFEVRNGRGSSSLASPWDEKMNSLNPYNNM